MEEGMVAPGFRFYPTEEELVMFYLKKKIKGIIIQGIDLVIPQLDVYEFSPWDLPQYAGELCRGDPEQWFFFIPRQEKEAKGGRPCRLTSSGYWKATGTPSDIYSAGNQIVGKKRTMVFYKGRAPTGKKTEWKMNEYKVVDEEATETSTTDRKQLMGELSLCRVYKKSKCLRAFDRRPVGIEINDSETIQQHHKSNDQATKSSHFNHPSVLIERTSSSPDHSSNSSGDHAMNPSDNIMDMDNKPFWEWEDQFNWFKDFM